MGSPVSTNASYDVSDRLTNAGSQYIQTPTEAVRRLGRKILERLNIN